MRKFDILVPIILISCLIALAYILTQIFSEQEQLVQPRADQSEIVLDPSRYVDEEIPPANTSNTPDALAGSDAAGNTSNRLDDYYNEDDTPGEDLTNDPSYETQPSATTTDYVSESDRLANDRVERSSSTAGRYLVIAGSFRQEIYAKDRVKNLKASGFKQTEMGYTNRGAYAVALVDAVDSYSQAEQLAQQVKAKGYEVFIKQRR